jgi:hypothetical protein
VKFSGSSPRVWGAKATIMVATAPQRTAPELSNSLVYNPLRVNDRVAFGPRRSVSNRPGFPKHLRRALQTVFGVLGGSA